MVFSSMRSKKIIGSLLAFFFLNPTNLFGFFPIFSGKYGLRPIYVGNPLLKTNEPYIALGQGLIISLEGKVNEKSSFFAEMNFFSNNSLKAMGSLYSSSNSEFFFPGHKSFQKEINSLYIKHDFNYFVFEAGRRKQKKWAQGLFFDGGGG